MKRQTRRSLVFVLALTACRGAAPLAEAPAKPAELPRAAAVELQPAAQTLPFAPLTPRLSARARALADREQTLPAVRLLCDELAGRVAARVWNDELLLADSVVAALVLEELLESSYAWAEAVARLEPALPLPAETPQELRASLELTLARAALRMGRIEEARKTLRAQGVISDWQMIGPFANERRSGFDTVYPPEEQIDLTSAVRGKEREVAWRPNPAPEQPLGNCILDEVFRPNEQVVAYLATALRVETPRSVCLWLGSTGEVKLWHGARLALSRKVQRPFHRDQDRVVLQLRAGWNPLLIKLGHEEEGNWIATARLTELDGSPLRDLAIDSTQAVDGMRVVAEPTETPTRSARELLEARGDDAEALRLLALWHLAVHPDDTAAHSAKALAERAATLAPDDVDTLYLVARANEPEPGESAEEIRHNERLMPLKRILELEPEHVGALVDLANFWTSLNPRPAAAEEASARALQLAPDSRRVIAARVRALSRVGRDSEANVLSERARSTAEGRLRPESIVASARAAQRRGEPQVALELLRAAAAGPSCDRVVIDELIDAHLERGELDAAIAVNERWMERSPYDVSRLLATAERCEAAGRTPPARQLVKRALHVCPEDTRAHRLLARIAEREGDLAGADAELAEVMRLDPGYDKARRQRGLLAAQTEEPERFEGPWRWDALERVGSVPPSGGANDPVQVVDRTTVWRVEPDGTEHHYEHVLLQVENTAGVKALDSYWIPYPDDASLQVYNVRIVHADGSFERAPAPRGGDSPWNGNYVRGFDLPPLVAGDMVDVEYRIDQTRPDVFGQYFGLRHAFQVDFPDALAPVHRAELVVLAPADVKLHTFEHNGAGLERSVEQRDGLVVHRWIARDLVRPASESAMPDRSEFAPLVDVSTFENWQAFAAWWWSFIEKEFVTTPAMKEKVAELTNGLASEADKVRAIARFVGQEIRYNAWVFGTHGYQPFSAATIFERRFGDCKDKSILLRQMLAEIGVESHPVLINAQYRRPDEKLDVAMVGHFNHCIAYLPATAERAGYYLDATADRNPVEYLRTDDQGARVLHVRDGRGEIVQIPYAPPEQNALVRRYEVQLERDGSGEVHWTDESVGAFGVQNRYRFGGEKGDLKQRLADALAQAFGKVDVLEGSTSVLEDIGAPARVEARVRAANLWTRESRGASLRLGFDDIPVLDVAAEPAEEREWELVLDRPFQLRSTVLYRLPQGARVSALPPDASVSAPGLIDYTVRARSTPDGVEVERVFTLHERRIARARYADFREALNEIRTAEARSVVLEDLAGSESGKKEDK